MAADMRAALANQYEIVDGKPDDAPRPGIRIAVTTPMAGAPSARIEALPDLKLIANTGVGMDRFDLRALGARGIAVAYTSGVVTEDVADCAIGLMYGAARMVAEADRFVRAGRWGKERIRPSISLHRKTAGIAGMGSIGQAIARRCAGLGMDVLWAGPRPKPDVGFPRVPTLRELAERADVLIMAVPGGPGTAAIVDGAVLAALGPKGIFVNIARGSVVDEPALLHALENGIIAGAGLDVFASEPEIDPRFLALENVVLAPHSATITRETRAAIIARVMADIAAFREGRPFLNAAAP
jgi:lactate dehydrogenase-like 2-hydroxyacid dehydrogenase